MKQKNSHDTDDLALYNWIFFLNLPDFKKWLEFNPFGFLALGRTCTELFNTIQYNTVMSEENLKEYISSRVYGYHETQELMLESIKYNLPQVFSFFERPVDNNMFFKALEWKSVGILNRFLPGMIRSVKEFQDAFLVYDCEEGLIYKSLEKIKNDISIKDFLSLLTASIINKKNNLTKALIAYAQNYKIEINWLEVASIAVLNLNGDFFNLLKECEITINLKSKKEKNNSNTLGLGTLFLERIKDGIDKSDLLSCEIIVNFFKENKILNKKDEKIINISLSENLENWEEEEQTSKPLARKNKINYEEGDIKIFSSKNKTHKKIKNNTINIQEKIEETLELLLENYKKKNPDISRHIRSCMEMVENNKIATQPETDIVLLGVIIGMLEDTLNTYGQPKKITTLSTEIEKLRDIMNEEGNSYKRKM